MNTKRVWLLYLISGACCLACSSTETASNVGNSGVSSTAGASGTSMQGNAGDGGTAGTAGKNVAGENSGGQAGFPQGGSGKSGSGGSSQGGSNQGGSSQGGSGPSGNGGNGGQSGGGSGGGNTAGTGNSAGQGGSETGTGSIVTVSGYQLMVRKRLTNGQLSVAQPYDIKGISWSPFGANESFTSDGSIYSIHGAQDIPLMASAHINTVKTYSSFEKNAKGLAVLDTLYANNMMVVMMVFAAYDTNDYQQVVTMFKDHPAILMWVVGNEWNYNNLYSNHSMSECIQKVNSVIADIKSIDSNHPVATVYGEVPTPDILAQVNSPDVWGLNLYPYLDFNQRFSTWHDQSSQPMFVSEYGADAYDINQNLVSEDKQAYALDVLTKQVRMNLSAKNSTKVCLGGMPFEWNDEWWKGGNPANHDISGYNNGGVYDDGHATEEWWGIVDANRNPRKAYSTLQMLYQP
jgi:hypothetical protein